MRRALADIAEFQSTDDRRSKKADITLSDAHRGTSYKVSAFTKIEGEQSLFYDLLRFYQSTISRNMHFFPIVCTLSTVIRLYPHRLRDILTIERFSFVSHIPLYIILPSAPSSGSIRSQGEISWICAMHRSSRAYLTLFISRLPRSLISRSRASSISLDGDCI